MRRSFDKTRVYVAGNLGMVGGAICRQLQRDPSVQIITSGRHEVDLTDQAQVKNFFSATYIDQVYLAAAKVGGIHANNNYPAEFIYQNLMIEANVIHSAFEAGVNRLLFLGSSCIYPRDAEQPMSEHALLSGKLEPTNEPYAIAKIAGVKLCESYNRQYGTNYQTIMPTNLYGPHDNFHPELSHVLPALLRRFHEAKLNDSASVTVWGTGTSLREFLHVDDLADAAIFLMGLSENRAKSPQNLVNVGSGKEISIADLAKLIASIVGFEGAINWDHSKPDGTPRKLMDSSKMRSLGWTPKVGLRSGVESTYAWYLENLARVKA